MPKAYGYLRVSTGRQVDAGNGMDAQADSIRRYFEYKLAPAGIAWAGSFEDPATSGDTPFRNRRGGVQLQAALEPGDHLVVHKLDRAFRNVRDCLNTLEWFKERGVLVHFLDLNVDTQSAVGRLFLQIVAAFAEWERNRLSERTREALAARRARKRPIGGGKPYGLTRTGPKGDRYYAPDPGSRILGKKIVEFVDAGWSFHRLYIHFLEERVRHRNQEVSLSKIRRYYIAEKQLQEKERQARERQARHTYPQPSVDGEQRDNNT